jgi:cobyrinic acid a,c-diamide synthase
MRKLATKIIHAIAEVQTKLQVSAEADLSPGTIKTKLQMAREAGTACAKTTDTAFTFYYKLTKLMVEDLEWVISRIQKHLDLPASAFEKREVS